MTTGLYALLLLSRLALPAHVAAFDLPGDNGTQLGLQWAPLDAELAGDVYVIASATREAGPFHEVKRFAVGTNQRGAAAHLVGSFAARRDADHYLVAASAQPGEPQYYRIELMSADGTETRLVLHASGTAHANWFAAKRANNLLLTIVLCAFVLLALRAAQRHPNLYIRKIAGLEAIDEAVGRATEMGKPILYSTGYHDADNVSTLASINILAHVANKVAQYDSRLIVPCKWSVAMAVCQETVREAYAGAGRPEAFHEHDVYYVAGEQFSYTAAVDGIMVRERPAANFLLGTFAAEALILAETGASTGAIQIAGTDSSFQIPFFVVCCDYCLIGEELYAASAYLSRDRRLLGTLRGQDLGKLLLGAAILLGSLGLTVAALGGPAWLEWVRLLFAAV